MNISVVLCGRSTKTSEVTEVLRESSPSWTSQKSMLLLTCNTLCDLNTRRMFKCALSLNIPKL